VLACTGASPVRPGLGLLTAIILPAHDATARPKTGGVALLRLVLQLWDGSRVARARGFGPGGLRTRGRPDPADRVTQGTTIDADRGPPPPRVWAPPTTADARLPDRRRDPLRHARAAPPAVHDVRRTQAAPETHEAFQAFSRQVFADGALPEKIKQLITVAVAHVTQCPYCIRGHARLAQRRGASEQEIMEAVWVAAQMRAGGAYAHSVIALDALTEEGGRH
jgi:AhpD family alkylhydroperoxidase